MEVRVFNVTPQPHYLRQWPGTHCTGCWVGPRAGLGGWGKSRHPPGFHPRTVHPLASGNTDWAIPAHDIFELRRKLVACFNGLSYKWITFANCKFSTRVLCPRAKGATYHFKQRAQLGPRADITLCIRQPLSVLGVKLQPLGQPPVVW
jgi:hypothetical protein